MKQQLRPTIQRGDRVALLIPCALFVFAALNIACKEELPKKARASYVEPAVAIEAKSPEHSRVLLVHSYHAEYPWVAAITRGVREVLDPAGVTLDIRYMDTKRITTEAWKRQSGEQVMDVVEESHPDAIIAADDNAQQYFAMALARQHLPVFFCGVNADPAKYGYPASNISGIIERPHARGSFEFLGSFVPVKRIAILSSKDPTSVGALTFMRERLSDEWDVTEFHLVSTFDEWKAAVRQCNDGADALGVYMYHTIKDTGSEKSMEPEDVMAWTREHVRIPTVGFFDFGIKDGLLCGVVESGEEHGREAAVYALEALRGRPIASLPVIKATQGKKMINKAVAKRLGLDLSGPAFDGVETVPGE